MSALIIMAKLAAMLVLRPPQRTIKAQGRACGQLGQPLPVCPEERTSSNRPGWFGSSQTEMTLICCGTQIRWRSHQRGSKVHSVQLDVDNPNGPRGDWS
jgi:hypothetical protein